jgi:hypothetical protein
MLQNAAMIVRLSISTWAAKKLDRKATKDVETSYNAVNAGRFNKNLIAEDRIKSVTKTAGKIRTLFYDQTLPWNDGGERLLPSKNFMNFQTCFAAVKSEFEKETSDFIKDYPQLRDDARTFLGGLFNPADYPDADEIAAKFGVSVDIRPIEDAGDFRVAIQQEDAERIRREIENRNTERIREATEHLLSRLRDAVRNLHDRLTVPDAVFKNSLTGNIEELITLAPQLNFAGDAKITQVIANMHALVKYPPETLRSDMAARSETARKAREILCVSFGINCDSSSAA